MIALVTWGVTTPGTAAAGCAAATPPTPTVAAKSRAGAIREVSEVVGVMSSSCVWGSDTQQEEAAKAYETVAAITNP